MTLRPEAVLLEVYGEVRAHAARFDRNRESLLTWLVTIAHRRALEHLCSSSADQQFVVSVGLGGSPGSSQVHTFGISKSAHRRLVGATLDALSPGERRMIEMAYFSRMTPRAIAVKLRQSPDAVKVRSAIRNLAALQLIQESGISQRGLGWQGTIRGNGFWRLQADAFFGCRHSLNLL